jgi:hypothetical protein
MVPYPIVGCELNPPPPPPPPAKWYSLDIDYPDSEYVSTNAGLSFWYGTIADAKAKLNLCENCPGFWTDSTITDENSPTRIRYYMISRSTNLNNYKKRPAKTWDGLMWFKPTIPRPVGL